VSTWIIHRWRWCCQPYAPAALYPQEYSWYSFLLEAESTPGAIVRLEGLGKLKKIHLIGNRSRDLPACSIVSQPTALPRTPPLDKHHGYFKELYGFSSLNFWIRLKAVILSLGLNYIFASLACSSTLKMWIVHYSETSVNFCQDWCSRNDVYMYSGVRFESLTEVFLCRFLVPPRKCWDGASISPWPLPF
jgi:hypothetical protein